MKYSVTVTRECSKTKPDTILCLRINGNIQQVFDDTNEGREQARKEYQFVLNRIKEIGEVNETLFKEEVETNG